MDKYAELIGVPFEYGGRGPEKYDCYGLLKKLFKDDDQNIPDYLSPTDGARITALMLGELHLWKECAPKSGRALLFKLFGNMHVGYCLGNGRFIHTWEQSGGVVIERMSDWEVKLIGCYEYVGS